MAAGFSVVCGAGACGYRARMKHGRPVWARARVAAVLSASRGSVSWLGRGYPRACWGLPPAPPCTHSLLSPILGRLESALSWISCGFEVIEPAAFFFFFLSAKIAVIIVMPTSQGCWTYSGGTRLVVSTQYLL